MQHCRGTTYNNWQPTGIIVQTTPNRGSDTSGTGHWTTHNLFLQQVLPTTQQHRLHPFSRDCETPGRVTARPFCSGTHCLPGPHFSEIPINSSPSTRGTTSCTYKPIRVTPMRASHRAPHTFPTNYPSPFTSSKKRWAPQVRPWCCELDPPSLISDSLVMTTQLLPSRGSTHYR